LVVGAIDSPVSLLRQLDIVALGALRCAGLLACLRSPEPQPHTPSLTTASLLSDFKLVVGAIDSPVSLLRQLDIVALGALRRAGLLACLRSPKPQPHTPSLTTASLLSDFKLVVGAIDSPISLLRQLDIVPLGALRRAGLLACLRSPRPSRTPPHSRPSLCSVISKPGLLPVRPPAPPFAQTNLVIFS
jgi:hypothetical protein